MACIIPIKVDIRFEIEAFTNQKDVWKFITFIKKYGCEKLTIIYISFEFSKDVKNGNARSLVLPKPSFSWDDEESANSLKTTFHFYVSKLKKQTRANESLEHVLAYNLKILNIIWEAIIWKECKTFCKWCSDVTINYLCNLKLNLLGICC